MGVTRIEVFEFDDGPGNERHQYRRAIGTLQDLVNDHAPVLVHCHAGRSRSPIVVAGFFVVTEQLEPDDAMARVASKREINVSEGLEELLHWP